jgi:hypothetical protein
MIAAFLPLAAADWDVLEIGAIVIIAVGITFRMVRSAHVI